MDSQEMDDASQGISAMIIFITVILVSSVISAALIGFGEKIFANSKTDAQENVPTTKGIVNILVLEIFSVGADDTIHIVFEMPYIEGDLNDDELAWVVMCYPQNQGGGKQTMAFDEGDFEDATDLDGDGATAAAIDVFEPAVAYRMILPLDDCDLNNIDKASLVLMVERGKTMEWQMHIGDAPYQGQDLN
tara:strand:+ start:913 stop:1482 length:570 start_codon:yes stop_codon:yes gene_type:complete